MRSVGFRHVVAAIIVLWVGSDFESRAEDPGWTVQPPGAVVHGKSLGEWASLWWQWALSFPDGVGPVDDTTGERCGMGQPKDVWFLAGNFTGGTTVRDRCIVPVGKSLFFPIYNSLSTFPFPPTPGEEPGTCEQACAGAKQGCTSLSLFGCTIDGVAVPELDKHEEISPDCFVLYLPASDVGPACLQPSCTHGLYLMLDPLPPGDHEIHFWASCGEDPENPEWWVDVTYLFTVGEPSEMDPVFRRGDTDGNGTVELTDAVKTLGLLFLGDEPPGCLDAADADDNGALEIADPISTLRFLFLGYCMPPWPGPEEGPSECAADPTEDSLAACVDQPNC